VGTRLAATLIGAFLLAGCGSAAEQTRVPGASSEATASGEGIATTISEADTDSDESALKPPPILLISDTGKQKGVYGSYCVDYVDEASGQGQGVCGDTAGAPVPESVTTVGPGDPVTIVLQGATVKGGTVTVRPLGCTDQEVEKLELPPSGELRWRVDLEPGGYQLDLFVTHFESETGSSGDVSGSLGLYIASGKNGDALGVVQVKPWMQVCKFAD
jgi:hypothetical protein